MRRRCNDFILVLEFIYVYIKNLVCFNFKNVRLADFFLCFAFIPGEREIHSWHYPSQGW